MWLQNGNLFQFVWLGLGTLGIHISKLEEAVVHVSHWAPVGYAGDSLMDWRDHPIIRVYKKIPWDVNLFERSQGLDRHGFAFQYKGNIYPGPINEGPHKKSYQASDTPLTTIERLGLAKEEVQCLVEFFGPEKRGPGYPELRVFLGSALAGQFGRKKEVTAQVACLAITEFWPTLAQGESLQLSMPSLPQHEPVSVYD